MLHRLKQAKELTISCMYFSAEGTYEGKGHTILTAALFVGCSTPLSVGERLRGINKCPGVYGGIWRHAFLIVIHELSDKPQLIPADT